MHRDPVAVLAGVLDQTDPIEPRSAVAVATESADEAAAVRTPAEVLGDAAHLAATERTASWLDRLTHDGLPKKLNDSGCRSTSRPTH